MKKIGYTIILIISIAINGLAQNKKPVYVAISGGGFHTHTCMSAWISGIMRHKKIPLDTIFQNVQGISCNSGGSWFLSHLAYSNIFVNALVKDSKSEVSTWGTKGYIGAVDLAFFKGKKSRKRKLRRKLSVAIQTFPGTGNSWYRFVEKKVHAPLGIHKDLKGKSLHNMNDRLEWSRNKDFVIAAALPKDTVVLQHRFFHNQFYSARQKNNDLILNGFVPMSFSGVPVTRKAAPLFLSGPQQLTYANHRKQKIEPISIIIKADYPQNIGIIDATVASSSAFGVVASEASLGELEKKYDNSNLISKGALALADYAPAINFEENRIKFIPETDGMRGRFEKFAKEKMARVADGGYLDNSSVAFQLRHMKENDALKDGFKLVLFMNGSYHGVKSTWVDSIQVNLGIAYLFGHDGGNPSNIASGFPDKGEIWYEAMGRYMKVPSPQVFTYQSWIDGKTPVWTKTWDDKSTKKKTTIQVFKIKVTTVENRVYGVPEGIRGEIYIFEVRQPGSFAMPQVNEIDTYISIFEKIRDDALTDGKLIKIIDDALGIN